MYRRPPPLRKKLGTVFFFFFFWGEVGDRLWVWNCLCNYRSESAFDRSSDQEMSEMSCDYILFRRNKKGGGKGGGKWLIFLQYIAISFKQRLPAEFHWTFPINFILCGVALCSRSRPSPLMVQDRLSAKFFFSSLHNIFRFGFGFNHNFFPWLVSLYLI